MTGPKKPASGFNKAATENQAGMIYFTGVTKAPINADTGKPDIDGPLAHFDYYSRGAHGTIEREPVALPAYAVTEAANFQQKSDKFYAHNREEYKEAATALEKFKPSAAPSVSVGSSEPAHHSSNLDGIGKMLKGLALEK